MWRLVAIIFVMVMAMSVSVIGYAWSGRGSDPGIVNLQDTVVVAPLMINFKRVNKERVIVPGVSYIIGEGLSIKLSKPEETIEIQRSTSYSRDYQLFWKKKY
ncbi:MAG: hypothetical protein H6Q73_2861 [Firmicutes bacterium]|nr:hypothetical protein [Bacillota bacterium]